MRPATSGGGRGVAARPGPDASGTAATRPVWRLEGRSARLASRRDRATVPLILDVDTGIDDSLALLYAAASPEAELVAVTCVSGNVEARQVATNTLGVLELAGRTDVEVAHRSRGAARATARDDARDPRPAGLGYAELPPPSRGVSDRHGVDLILDEARRRPGEITLVTLGPLTNLAVALEREPALPRLLRGLRRSWAAPSACPATRRRRPSGTSTATRRRHGSCSARGPTRSTPIRPIARPLGARPRRHRGRPDHGRSTSCGWRGAPAARPTTRSGSRRSGRSAGARTVRWPRTRSSASSPTRCASTSSSTAAYDGFYGAFIHDPLASRRRLDRGLVTSRARSTSMSRPAAS